MKSSIRRWGKNSWELTIDLGRDPHGNRPRKFVSVKGRKSDAERHLRELLGSLDRGLPVSTDKITVADWLGRWLAEHVAPNRRQRTFERYRDVTRKHVTPHIGHVQLTRLTPSDIKALETQWVLEGMTFIGVEYATASCQPR